MSTASHTERPSLLRRLRFPLIVLSLPILIIVLINVLDRTDAFPEAMFPLFFAVQGAVMLALILLPIWFLFFSGFHIATKLLGVVLVAAGVGGFIYSIREVEFTGSMAPKFTFIWEPERFGAPDALPATGSELVSADVTVSLDDFPRYRGAAADGVAPPTPMPTDWATHPPKIVWRKPVGDGHSGFAVAGKVAITLEQRGDEEAVVCYDRANAKPLWSHAYSAHFQHTKSMGGGGPRSTPTIADGDVYSLGAVGDLVCLDAATGKPRWSVNILTDNGAKNIEWAMTGSPLLVGTMVVVNPGINPQDNKKQAVAAYDRKTGKKVWAAGDKPAGYSSPRLGTLDGMEQILLFDGGGLAGIDPKDGKELWRHSWTTFSDMNIIQPLVLPGDKVFISSELANGCTLLHVHKKGNAWAADVVWQNREMAAKFANPVYVANHLYGLHNGRLCCLNAETGKRQWKGENIGSGQLLLSGNHLIVQTEEGEVVAAAAEPSGYQEIGRLKVFTDRTWNTPALAGGRLYLRNHKEMACVDLNPKE
jgi:outer membrane protein assembly factor BamB